MKEVKAYQCDHCKFYKKTKVSVINHEKTCYHNPEKRACATCKHNVIDFEKSNFDPENIDGSYNFCRQRDVTLKRGTLQMNCFDWKSK